MTQIATKAYAYNDYLKSFAMRYTHNTEDAQDAVQNVYLYLLTRSGIETVNDETFGGYLRRMLLMDLLEKKQKDVETEEVPLNASTAVVNSDDREFAKEVLRRALKAIPCNYREIFRQYYSGMNAEMIFNRQTKYSHVCCIHNIIRKYDAVLRKEMRRLSKELL